jgi:hypothetical protein
MVAGNPATPRLTATLEVPPPEHLGSNYSTRRVPFHLSKYGTTQIVGEKCRLGYNVTRPPRQPENSNRGVC